MLSKEEIEKAKEFLWDIDDYYTEHSTDEFGNIIDEDMNEKAEKINNANYYIMQLEQENKKQNKMIDEMANKIYEEDIIWKNKEEAKQYFEKKVEGK